MTQPSTRPRDDVRGGGAPEAATPVLLDAAGRGAAPAHLLDLAGRARAVAGRARPAVDLLPHLGAVPLPGSGGTLARWELLASLAAADLTAARVAEAHLDALAILAESRAVAAGPAGDAADPPPDGSTWGVFAAEAPRARLQASPCPDGRRGSSWELSGTKPWCSLAGVLSDALVTAHTDAGRRLFRIDLTHPGVGVSPDQRWVSRGLAEVVSSAVDLDRVPALPVGDAGWYLRRPGFAWGGLGVAACWYGGAVGVARRLLRAVRDREPDQVALVHLGAVDVALAGARTLLADAAARVDAGLADGVAGALLAGRVRAGVVGAAEEVLGRVGHALGPAPLTFEEEHARRVADLTVYLRQDHAERDLAVLGAALAPDGSPAW